MISFQYSIGNTKKVCSSNVYNAMRGDDCEGSGAYGAPRSVVLSFLHIHNVKEMSLMS